MQAGELPQGHVLQVHLCEEFDAHVRRYLWCGHFWAGSYFAGSRGGAPLTVVPQYIENQQRPV
ncbi:transposase [Streptomyces sp. NPDC055105]|uniref:transposase n=1 Tax=Streptomyces sp. NPDC055105 TaxID=3365719 RepID=UPI0037D8C0AE